MDSYDDEDSRREEILKLLSGEVDDFAGSQLKNPDEKESPQGVTIEISVKPHGGEMDSAEHEAKETPEEEKEEHDEIAHILGMHSGGCPG